ncbi:helix-turn-helix transcriptional regulator [Dysgonomonas sp. Marseille-P4677]|uniref:helix-turn-helix domain-containing protein n=1 Tax=Dysgonomonas sp. Marseille-P4677 TaxID=2364790 RepID=UPI0019143EA1|nr:AraC family transcriptional regulator [Dysgonomonas sp. Marseille-P4677]MBK5722275.1 helix-turn-helix transcriptional regulator [Dysgonomonas sp. Marseille-P4677]
MLKSIDELYLLVLNVGLAVHNADWNWKDVNSPFTRLYYVTEGNAKLILPSGVQNLKPDHLYLIPSFTKHDYECDSYFCHYYIHIYEDIKSGIGLLDDWSFPVEVPSLKTDKDLFARLCEINPFMKLKSSNPASYDNNPTLIQNIIKNKQRAFCDQVESRGITYQLLSRFLKNIKPKIEIDDDRIHKALSHIRKNIHNSITIDDLSESLHMSKDHFIRLFKKKVGTTPLQYINQKKIEKAQLILIANDMSIKNIAYMLAFEDHSYFNRLFKASTGLTPQEYRNIHMKG